MTEHFRVVGELFVVQLSFLFEEDSFVVIVEGSHGVYVKIDGVEVSCRNGVIGV